MINSIFRYINPQVLITISNRFKQVENAQADGQTCDNASSYCGIRNARYPDARSMGYPFDRTPRDGVVTLQQFLTPNMAVQDVRIRFSNRTVAPLQNRTGTQQAQTPKTTPAKTSSGGSNWN